MNLLMKKRLKAKVDTCKNKPCGMSIILRMHTTISPWQYGRNRVRHKKMVWTQEQHTLIKNDHLGDWSPEKDCGWRLTFRQPLRKPSSEFFLFDPENHFRTGSRNVSRQPPSFSGLQSPRWSFLIRVRHVDESKQGRNSCPWFPHCPGDMVVHMRMVMTIYHGTGVSACPPS